MTFANLNQKQTLALIEEMTSTRNLLAYGVRVVRTGAFVSTTRDPILTMLSIGVEKLYKLTLGLIALDVDKQWPSAKVMRANGHKLGDMHQKVIAELRKRTRSRASMSAACSPRPNLTPSSSRSSRRSTCTAGRGGSTTSINSVNHPKR